MKFNVKTIANFDRELKRLAKKYSSLRDEFATLIDSLEKNPTQGEPLGMNCYKIRLAIASKGKGKSGGARVITHIHIAETTVYLLSIYDKSEQQNIADKDIMKLLKEL